MQPSRPHDPVSPPARWRHRRHMMVAGFALLGIAAVMTGIRNVSKGSSSGRSELPRVEIETLVVPHEGSPEITMTRRTAGKDADADRFLKDGSLGAVLDEARRRIMPIEGSATGLPENQGTRLFLQNPGQQLTARFGPSGTVLAAPVSTGLKVSMSYVGAGEESLLRGEGTTATYTHRDGVIEWFKNRAEGIEHGFELPSPLAARGQRDLKIRLEGMKAVDTGQPAELRWEDPATGAALAYSGLKVWDSVGKDLAAGLVPDAQGFVISIDDRSAVYPVFVDPLITRVVAKLAPLTTGDGAEGDEFGRSVSTDGTRLAVGAWGNDGYRGAVYLFTKNGEEWDFDQRLTLAGAAPGDWFGEEVEIEGDTLVVAAKGRTQNSVQDLGAVYVYEREAGTWAFKQMLQPEDRYTGAHFGSSLALEGKRLLIGADGDDGSTPSPEGHGYIFEKTDGQWLQTAKLTDPEAQYRDYLGYSVALSGDVAYLSKPANGMGQVLAFVRQESGWQLVARLSGVVDRERFGHSIAADGDVLAVGSNFANGLAGSVRVFRRSGSTWNVEATLTASNPGAGARFGSAVSVEGSRLLVGAIFSNYQYGSAYVFDKGSAGWAQSAILDPWPAADFQGLAGYAVALAGDVALVGAPESDTPAGDYAGMVHVHALKAGAWGYRELMTAGDGEEKQGFGSAVDIEGDRVAVGMKLDNTPYGERAGSAYVFRRNGASWETEAIFQDTDPEVVEQFGSAVDLDGDRLLVGNPYDVIRSSNPTDWTLYRYGSASFFRLGAEGWELEAKVRAAVPQQDRNFGRALSLNGDVAVIASGAPYVFRRTGANWQQESILSLPGGSASAVVLQQDRVLVASSSRRNAAGKYGAVFEFVRQSGVWSHSATVEPQTWFGLESFGNALAAEGEVMVVGTRRGQMDTEEAAYVFRRSPAGWQQEARLLSPDADAAQQNDFGSTVALKNGTILVGAPADAPRAGGVHVFRQQEGVWTRAQKLFVPGLEFQGGFGSALATDGELAVIATAGEDIANPLTGDIADQQGSVHVFHLGAGEADVDLRRLDHPFYTEGSAVFDFGMALVGGYRPLEYLEIFNQGSVPLTGITLGLSGAEAGQFEIGAHAGTLAPGERILVELRFGPLAAGVKTTTLTVSSSDPDEATRTIQLTGTGNSAPRKTARRLYGIQGRPLLFLLEDMAYDPDGDPIRIQHDGEPKNTTTGIFRLTSDTMVFEPHSGVSGTVNFGFGVIDDKGSTDLIINYFTLLPEGLLQPGEGVSRIAPDVWAVSLKGLAGETRKIERSPDLHRWTEVGTMTADTQGRILLIDHGAGEKAMFYRLAE